MNQYEPQKLQALDPSSDRHIVRNVGSGAIAADENPTEIGVIVEPGLSTGSVRVREHPLERVPRVFVRDGERVVRREAVVDGDCDDVGVGGEGGGEVVELGAGGRAEAESTAVYVDQDGEFLVRGGGDGGEEEADGYGGFCRDHDVFGSDGGLGVVGCGSEFGFSESLDAAVFVYAKEGREIVGYFSGD